MKYDQDTLPIVVELASELPLKIRKKFSKYGPEQNESRVLMLRTSSEEKAKFVTEVLNIVESALSIGEKELSDARIDNLVQFYLGAWPTSEIDRKIERDNATLRARYLESTKSFTSSQLHEQSNTASKNKSDLASKWKSRKRVFAGRYGGIDYYPAFQFDGGQPKKIIGSILRLLPDDMSSWQIAFWFTSENVWLDDKPPEQCLDDGSSVLVAAEHVDDVIFG